MKITIGKPDILSRLDADSDGKLTFNGTIVNEAVTTATAITELEPLSLSEYTEIEDEDAVYSSEDGISYYIQDGDGYTEAEELSDGDSVTGYYILTSQNCFAYAFDLDETYKIVTPEIPDGYNINDITFSFPSVTDTANKHTVQAFVYISSSVVFNWGEAGSINFLNSKLPTINSGETYLLDAVYDPNTEKWCVSMTRQASTGIYDLPSEPIALNECTREQILAVIQHGYANSFNQWCVRRPDSTEQVWWELGDSFDITLTDNTVLTFQIAGYNYDDLADGTGKAKITFVMKNLWKQTYQRGTQMNWSDSLCYTTYIPAILSTFPDDWKNVMVSVLKETPISSAENEITTDTLWVPSVNETDGHDGYPLLRTAGNRVKSINGTVYGWRLRHYIVNTQFNRSYGVHTDGSIVDTMNNSAHGLCLGFCLNG